MWVVCAMAIRRIKGWWAVAACMAAFVLIIGAVVAVRIAVEQRSTGSAGAATKTSSAVSPRLITGMRTDSAVTSMAFSPDGKMLAVGFENGSVQLRDPRTGRKLAPVKLGSRKGEGSFAFSPDGKTLAVGVVSGAGHGSKVDLFNVKTRKLTLALPMSVSQIYSLAFSPDGKALAIAGGTFLVLLNLDTRVSIYVPDHAPHDMIGGVYNPTGEASYVSYSADGKWLAVGGILGQVRLWNATAERFVKGTIVSPKGRDVPSGDAPSVTVEAATISPDARTVAIVGWIGGTMSSYSGDAGWLWHTNTGKITSLMNWPIYPSDNSGIAGVAFNRQGNLFATGDSSGAVSLWNVATGRAISTAYSPVSDYTYGLAFSPNGTTLASGQWVKRAHGSLTGAIQLWNVYAPPTRSATTTSSVVPVVNCPTTDMFPPSGHRLPTTETIPLPAAVGDQLAYYSDATRRIRPILAPRDWSCSVAIGADGIIAISVLHPGESPPSSSELPKGGEAVLAYNASACAGCIYQTACALVPHVARELMPSSPGAAGTCGHAQPRQQRTWLVGSPAYSQSGSDVVSVVDPPGVKGYLAGSGGQNPADGILLYWWGAASNPGASSADCTLPPPSAPLCRAILSAFRQQHWTGY